MSLYETFDLKMNETSLIGFLKKVNDLTDVGSGGVLGIFILIVVGFPLFLMMRSYGNERAFAVSGMITALIGLFLRIFGLIGQYVFYVCIILFAIGTILLLKEAAKYED